VLSIFVGDRLGRRWCIIIGCCILIVGGALQSASYWLPMIIIARIVAGVGNGLNTTAIPIWQSETSAPRIRGMLICIQLALVITGIVITEWMNFGFTYQTGDVTWRFPLAFQCFFAIATIAMVAVLPESPRWLALKDRVPEAQVIISRLLARPLDDPEVLAEVESIVSTVKHEASLNKAGWKEIFSGGKQQNFRRICLGAGASVFQQMGGINVVVYYLPIVLTQSFGFSNRLALILSAVDSMSLVFWGVVASFIVDKVGRKKLMLQAAIMDAICFACAAAGLAVGTKAGNVAAVVFIFLYYVFYASLLTVTVAIDANGSLGHGSHGHSVYVSC
jgi:MFS family permease